MNKTFLVGIIILGTLTTALPAKAEGLFFDMPTALSRLTAAMEELSSTVEGLKKDLRQIRGVIASSESAISFVPATVKTAQQAVAQASFVMKLSASSPSAGSHFLAGMTKIPIGIFELTNNENEYVSITQLKFSCSECDNLALIRLYANGALVTDAIKTEGKPIFSADFSMGNFPLKAKEKVILLVEADTNPEKKGATTDTIQLGIKEATVFNVVRKPMKTSPPVSGPKLVLHAKDIPVEDKSDFPTNRDGYCVVKSDFANIDLEKEANGFFKERVSGPFASLDELKKSCAYGHDSPAQQFCRKNPGGRYRQGVLFKDVNGTHFNCGLFGCGIVSC